MGLKNIQYLVQNFKLTKLNGYTETMFDQQFLQFAIEGMRKLRQMELLDSCMKCVELPVDISHPNHKLVNLPEDYEDFESIGICVNGRIINLERNDTLCLMDTPCCNESENEAMFSNLAYGANTGVYPYWYYPLGQPYSISYTLGSYGMGPGFYKGGYKLDLSKRQIILDLFVRGDKIVLTYFGDFLNNMGDAVVDDGLIEILLYYMDWARCEASIDREMYRRADRKKMAWFQSVRDYNAKRQKLTKSDWSNLLRAYTYLGVKD